MFEQITGLSEMIGAIGVILSLLYVGKQLKQTNAMARAAAYQTYGGQLTEAAMAIASSPNLAETLAKVHFNNLTREDATEPERVQAAYTYVAFMAQIHLAYEQTKTGILTPEEAEDLFGRSSALLRQPYLASVWPILQDSFPRDFGVWFARRFNLPAPNELDQQQVRVSELKG